MTPQAREEALAKIPCGRFGTVEEVADAAVFLATNAYANNCIVNLDGGLSATVSNLLQGKIDQLTTMSSEPAFVGGRCFDCKGVVCWIYATSGQLVQRA